MTTPALQALAQDVNKFRKLKEALTQTKEVTK